MKAFGLVLVLALAAFGCDDGGSGGTGGSGGSGPTGACLGTSDQEFVCSDDTDVKAQLTACGLCAALATGCPDDCQGNPVPPNTPQADCADLVMGPSCDPGLTEDCLGCYRAASQCGLEECAGSCSNILDPTAPNSPGGCECLDCVDTECDAAFEACAGYSQGLADSGTPADPAGDGEAGGPPTCQGPTYCEGGRAGGVCDNGVVEPPEECDPPGSPNDSNEFCDAECKFFDPCADPLDPPASCAAPTDPKCAATTCSEASGVITCGIADASAGTPCDLLGTNDGRCDGSGTCVGCTASSQCNQTDCTTGTCNLPAGTCSYEDQPAGTNCGTSGQCTSENPSQCTEGACTDETGTCATAPNAPCASDYECAAGVCSGNGNSCHADIDCGTCATAGTPCSGDFMCPDFGDSCTASVETCNGFDTCSETTPNNSAFICSPQGSQIKDILTFCGVCAGGLGDCPNDCFGAAQNPALGAPACMAGALLRTPEGLCPSGLDSGCLGCYELSVDCGSADGPPGGCLNDCASLTPGAIDGPNGCDCIDCITTECDPAFAACAGFTNGAPNGTPNAHTPIVGGPPVCEAIPTPACDN